MQAMAEDKIHVLIGADYGVSMCLRAKQALLERHSPWFRAALDPEKGFEESVTKIVNLPNYEAVAFQHCKLWMKHSIFRPPHDCAWKEFIMTWLLSEQFGMTRFCNEIVRTIVRRHWRCIRVRENRREPRDWAAGVSNVSASTMHYLYENTTSTSVLRKLFMHLFVDTRSIEPKMDDLDDYPDAFAEGVTCVSSI